MQASIASAAECLAELDVKGKLNQELEHIFLTSGQKWHSRICNIFYSCPWMPFATFILLARWQNGCKVRTSHSSRKNYANDASVLLLKWVAKAKKLSLSKRTQHCWMLHVASVCTPCCMLLDVVARCCAKFETGQIFQPTTPNIFFIPWSPKRSATMLDPFAQFFQHSWGHARSLRMVYKNLWVVSYPRCTAGPTPLPTRRQQLPTLLAQQCWELLRPFARSLKPVSAVPKRQRSYVKKEIKQDKDIRATWNSLKKYATVESKRGRICLAFVP